MLDKLISDVKKKDERILELTSDHHKISKMFQHVRMHENGIHGNHTLTQ